MPRSTSCSSRRHRNRSCQHPPGQASLNLLQMAREGWPSNCAVRLPKPREQRARSRASGCRTSSASTRYFSTCTSSRSPQRPTRSTTSFVFEQRSHRRTWRAAGPDSPPPTATRLVCRAELLDNAPASGERGRRQKRRATEELRAANEEIQSSNEELQSIKRGARDGQRGAPVHPTKSSSPSTRSFRPQHRAGSVNERSEQPCSTASTCR